MRVPSNRNSVRSKARKANRNMKKSFAMTPRSTVRRWRQGGALCSRILDSPTNYGYSCRRTFLDSGPCRSAIHGRKTIRYRWIILTLMLLINTKAAIATQLMPFLQYHMTTENCLASAFSNEGNLGEDSIKLVRNVSTTTCTLGFGVESKFHEAIVSSSNSMTTSSAMYASKPIGSFVEELKSGSISAVDKSGVTISLWIRPDNVFGDDVCNHNQTCDKDASTRNIFTIGWGTFSNNNHRPSALTVCDKSKIDLQLSITNTYVLEVIYRTSDQFFEPCQQIKANASSLLGSDAERHDKARPMHVAISLGNYRQVLFVNGKVLAQKREQFDVNLNHWNPTSLLQFFTYPTTGYSQPPPWDGQLLQFSIYGGALDKKQIKTILAEGLPPSQPIPSPKVVHINEDAMDENGTLQQIQLPYFFLDDEIDSLLSSLGLPHQPVAHVRHYITKFPTRGQLFHISDGQIIPPENDLPVLLSNMDGLVFAPRKDEHSEFLGSRYASFDYCVTTKKIIMSSQCAPATISLVVEPANDPPVATVPPLYTVYEGIQKDAQGLLLTGSDVDKNDIIQNVQITSPPKMGHLFLSVSSFRTTDNLLHGTVLADVNNTIPGKEAYIEYQFTEYNTTAIQDTLVVDSFWFRVQDSVGSWSKEAEVKIQVSSSVFTSSTVQKVEKAGAVNLQLNGVDLSGLNRTLGFLILSLPSNGAILDEEGTPLVQNQIVEPTMNTIENDMMHLASVNITYAGVPSMCNRRNNTVVNDTFKYQVVSMDPDNEIMSMSLAKQEQISMACPVQPISMQFVNEEQPVNTLTFISPANNSCSGYVFDFAEESRTACRGTTLVWGIRADNAEKLLEPVYVRIASSPGGFLTMNQNQLPNILALFDQAVMRRTIRLVVPAEKLNDVLSAIHFQSDSIGEHEIQVALRYGRCNHTETFLVDPEVAESGAECVQTQKTLRVNVQQNHQDVERSRYGFPWVSLSVIVALGPIFYIKAKATHSVEEIHREWKEEGTCDFAASTTRD